MLNEVNLEPVLAEVKSLFDTYETALINNNIEVLDHLFWHSDKVVRFGATENLYGIEAIRAFRKARDANALNRCLVNTMITTFGVDFATTTTEFMRNDKVEGRQSQTWVRFPFGWRIVSAHVSLFKSP
jgi:hypothetical protein